MMLIQELLYRIHTYCFHIVEGELVKRVKLKSTHAKCGCTRSAAHFRILAKTEVPRFHTQRVANGESDD